MLLSRHLLASPRNTAIPFNRPHADPHPLPSPVLGSKNRLFLLIPSSPSSSSSSSSSTSIALRQDIVMEVQVLVSLGRHPNVVQLIGVCVEVNLEPLQTPPLPTSPSLCPPFPSYESPSVNVPTVGSRIAEQEASHPSRGAGRGSKPRSLPSELSLQRQVAKADHLQMVSAQTRKTLGISTRHRAIWMRKA
jgi:hypothetical protein